MSRANVIQMPHRCKNKNGCPHNAQANNAAEVEEIFGYRMLRGKLAPQARCKPCR